MVLLNSCAVRLDEAHPAVLDECLTSGRQVAVLVTDQLYPTGHDHPTEEVRRYYRLLRQASVHAVSRTIADALHSQTGVSAQVLPNLLPGRRVGPPPPEAEDRFLTLINHHPIKGRRVWDALIRQRPGDAYLVVETWPDAPPYAPPSPHVRVAPFTPDPTTIYHRTRILLVPSLGPEGLPRVALEAMESGVPVVAHRIGSLPELGDAAMFVTPPPIAGHELDEDTVLYPVVSPSDIERAARELGRAIDAIDQDPALRTRLVARGRAYVRDYRDHSEAVSGRLLDAWFGTV
ncbi:glycosyltransferase [Streptomyces radicis]|uniref:D-inositol 3-phosphate glycosyltransferase n=1 Tax=Streptomyces radicis TaxID=1750517 RepID=A0A3A9WG87_9ACTN|nr:glycosyltransferase [Streptomyces radicis]RKN26075.1 glycosyltransferase [Streptomyces radicis]